MALGAVLLDVAAPGRSKDGTHDLVGIRAIVSSGEPEDLANPIGKRIVIPMEARDARALAEELLRRVGRETP